MELSSRIKAIAVSVTEKLLLSNTKNLKTHQFVMVLKHKLKHET